MSSGTSTEAPRLGTPAAPGGQTRRDASFQPWQLFTLLALISASFVAFWAGGHPPRVRVALILTVFAAGAIGVAMLRTLSPFTLKGGPAPPAVVGGRTRAALEREKTLVLRSIKELEFDRAMNKVSEKDFEEMSERLRARARRLIRELDADTGYRGEIEKEVARRLAAPAQPSASVAAPSTPAGTDDESSGHAAGAPPVATAALCASCSTRNDPDARFCKECGTRLDA